MSLTRFWVNTATVTPYLGLTALGETYGTPVTVTGLLEDTYSLGKEHGGVEYISKTTFMTDLGNADLFVPLAKFSCNGRDLTVDSVTRVEADTGPWAALSHLQVGLK